MIRVFWGELSGELGNLEQYEGYLQSTAALALNDCKSLADALNNRGSAVSKTSEDKRLAIELSMIRQRLAEDETMFQWVDNSYMAGNVQRLTRLMTENHMMIKPTEEMLEARARRREYLKQWRERKASGVDVEGID